MDFTVHYSTFLRGDNGASKTTMLTFRIEPKLKKAIRTATQREHRFIANMIEVMIRDYSGRNDIAITESPVPNTKLDRK